jgi:hypothetical protein
LFITVRPEVINGHMAAYDGKLLVHLPNYFLVATTQPGKPADGVSQVFAVHVDPNDVNEITDGGVLKTYIWRGGKSNRAQPHEMVSVEITAIGAAGSGAAPPAGDPVEVAKAAFGEYPEPVRIAAVVANAPAELVGAIPSGPGQLKVWADSTLAQYVASLK